MRYAIVDLDAELVTNVIVATPEFIEHLATTAAPGVLAVLVDDVPCGPGWLYLAGEFAPPALVESVIDEP